jgi:hypothetical protein
VSGISVIRAPGETLVGETLVTASSLRRNFRNFRKRYANSDGGPNVGHRWKPARGFRSFRKRSANYGGVDVPAQRQTAGAVWLASPRRVLDRAVLVDSGWSAGHGAMLLDVVPQPM